MATVPIQKQINPVTVEKFLGLNLSNTGDTQIKLGESGNMNNFYITNDYKLRKMYGYKSFYDFETQIKGIYSAILNNIHYLLVATNGKLYYFESDDLDDEENWDTLEPTLIGTIGTGDCSFFTFDNKVYILCGKYMSWDGTTLQEVEGYVPKVFFNAPPAGGGDEYEDMNLLTDKKYMTFNGDGTSTTYQISEKNVTSIYKVIVDNVEKTENTDYTVNLTNGTVSFTTAPSNNINNVVIYWSKTTNPSNRSFIEKMKFGTVFGGDVDTRVFLYGNPDERNRVRYSGPELDETHSRASVEYFPTFYQLDIGPKNFAVTDLTRQYNRLLVTTNKPEAYYVTLGTVELDEDTITAGVQTFPLNEAHGNVAMGQGQVLNNDPVTIENGAIIKWKSTNVRDERNMSDISQRIKQDLNGLNLVNVKTLDYAKENQYWLCNGNRVYIYNYYNDTYSRITLADEISQITALDGNVYMASQTGKLVKFGEQFDDYDGVPIHARWEMNFYDFEVEYLRKTMRKVWVLMQPQAKASATIGYITNKNESPVKKTIQYSLVFFDDVDFRDFSFQVSTNPQPFRLKLKAKKFTNLKLTVENKERTDCTILALSLRVETGGESK